MEKPKSEPWELVTFQEFRRFTGSKTPFSFFSFSISFLMLLANAAYQRLLCFTPSEFFSKAVLLYKVFLPIINGIRVPG